MNTIVLKCLASFSICSLHYMVQMMLNI